MRSRLPHILLSALCFFIAGVLTSPIASGQEYLQQEMRDVSSPAPSGAASEPSFTQLTVKMIIVLSVVIGLIILLGFGMKKMMKGRRFGAAKITTVLSVTHIVDRKYIAVVEVLGRTLILGVGADSVTLLADIGPAFLAETEEPSASAKRSPQRDAATFSQVLTEKVSTMESGQATSFLEALTDQVKKKIARLKG